uniref:Candidate secreted effector n=1 Tax=Meloidogyne incognita TaxID=6306 RepID=A0A914KRL1_MELIC
MAILTLVACEWKGTPEAVSIAISTPTTFRWLLCSSRSRWYLLDTLIILAFISSWTGIVVFITRWRFGFK